MSGGRPFILLGGGAFAVEVASYLVDLRKVHARGADSSAGPEIVSDVVAAGKVRLEDIARVTGGAPKAHQLLSTVENVAEKRAIVCIGDPVARQRVFHEAVSAGFQMCKVVHPSAVVCDTATIGRGAIICPFAFIGPFASVGDNAAVNVHAAIGHDAVLEHSSVISPAAAVNGFARTGTGSFVGAGAVLHPGSGLGAYSKLSAGSVLTKTVGDGFVMHGNPAVGRQMIVVPFTEGT